MLYAVYCDNNIKKKKQNLKWQLKLKQKKTG